jgi:hypothetical protein
MKVTAKTKIATPLFSLIFILLSAGTAATSPQPALPNPVLYLTGIESFQTSGADFTRYRFDVLNKDSYPAEMFAAAPALEPCGTNKNSSRTWLDFYDQSGKRLQGFCALKSPADLNIIWFAFKSDQVPPSYVFIELNDRQTNTKYKSNLAETTP